MAKNLVEKLRTFLSQQICLIADSSPAIAMSLRTKLVELGVPNAQIHTVSKSDGLRAVLADIKPTMFIVEYELGELLVDELIKTHETMHDPLSRTLIVLGRNSKTAFLLEERETQIDSFIRRPFSAEIFRDSLIGVAKCKVEPPPYLTKINRGRTFLSSGDTLNAMKTFSEAAELDPKPALAWYYQGETSRKLGQPERALECFREGLKGTPLHYRCSLAEFELLKEMKKPEAAFDLVESILAHFPVSRDRLAEFFALAVAIKRFDELPTLYKAYRELEDRSQELVEIVERSFLNAGQYLLAAGETETAISHFECGIQVASRRFDYVEQIVKELVSLKAVDQARAILNKISKDQHGSTAFEQLSFCVDQLTMTGDQLMNRGRQIVFSGKGTPDIFHLVVRSFAEAGKETLAESTIGKAVETNPELRESLYKVLFDHLPKQAA